LKEFREFALVAVTYKPVAAYGALSRGSKLNLTSKIVKDNLQKGCLPKKQKASPSTLVAIFGTGSRWAGTDRHCHRQALFLRPLVTAQTLPLGY
jgi:hypothetical protein